MKNFFLNLNIRSKLVLGFIIVIFILLFNGVKSYNIVSNLDYNNNEIIKKIAISNHIKQLKYLIMYEMEKVYELIYSESIKEFDKNFDEHTTIQNEIIISIDSLKNLIKVSDKEAEEQNTSDLFKSQVNDTTLAIETIYRKAFEISFAEVKRIKKEMINPTYLGEDITISILDSLKNNDSIASSDTSFASIFNQAKVTKAMQNKFKFYEKHLRELNEYIDQNGQQIIYKLNQLDVLSTHYLGKLNTEIQNVSAQSFNQTFWIVLFGLVISVLLAWFISNIITSPLHKVRNLMYQLSYGELPEKIIVETSDEIGNMGNALNLLVDGLRRTSDFAFEIGKGNFASEFQPLSDKDVLGNSLINMRMSLQLAKEEEEKRKIEDIQRNWATEGLAKFAEILRHHTENINELSNDIIKNLVKYLNANQGGIFIYNDVDPINIHLELLAVYAYNRKKYLEKKILLGEGLVGAVALEKYTIYLTDVPNEYIEIESGIGSSNPKCILIVPLKIENNILGVIELASFNELLKHEIELVEKIAESIAATLSTARITTRTAELLEQSKLQAQEMQEKEEELLQNIEELKTTQEESTLREDILKRKLKDIESTQVAYAQKEVLLEREIDKLRMENDDYSNELMNKETQMNNVLETSQDGVIIINDKGSIEFFNRAAQKIWGYKESEILGRNVKILMPIEYSKNHDNYISEFIKTGVTKALGKTREFPILKRDSSQTWIQITLCESRNDDNIKFVAFIKDLSTIKNYEDEQSKLKDTLLTKEFEYTVRVDELENKFKSLNIPLPEAKDDSELIRWEDITSVNLSTIDQQHKKWIDIINKLYTAHKSGTAFTLLETYFTELLEYTDYHFGFEEKYLEEFKVTKYQEHLNEHNKFIQKINELRNEYKEENADVSFKMMIFLKSWVKNHIENWDQKYVDTFKRNGLQ